MKRGKTQERTAYHEAGHAVIARHYGHDIFELTIDPQVAHTYGRMTHQGHSESLPDSSTPAAIAEILIPMIMKKISICLAGAAAEYIYKGEPKKFKNTLSGSDIGDAKELLNKFKMEPSVIIMRGFFHDVVSLLKSKWAAVEALADALIQKGTISGEEAIKIIERR